MLDLRIIIHKTTKEFVYYNTDGVSCTSDDVTKAKIFKGFRSANSYKSVMLNDDYKIIKLNIK